MEEKKGVVDIFLYIVAIVMIAMVLMVFVNAVLRYVFNTGIAAFEELARYAFIWVSSFGAIIAYYKDKHVGVDMLTSKLHGAVRLVFGIICEVVVILMLAVLLIGGYRYFVSTLGQDSAAIPVPLGVITFSPLFMSAAMLPKTFILIRKHFDDYKIEKAAAGGAK